MQHHQQQRSGVQAELEASRRQAGLGLSQGLPSRGAGRLDRAIGLETFLDLPQGRQNVQQ